MPERAPRANTRARPCDGRMNGPGEHAGSPVRRNAVVYDPAKHRRRSIRLRGYDYSRAGAYFVTICTQNLLCLFGEIVNGEMVPNDAGSNVERWYGELEDKFPDIRCDEFVCMPNHVHFVVVNTGAGSLVRPDGERHPVRADSQRPANETTVRADPGVRPGPSSARPDGLPAASSLSTVVQWFKTMTTNAYIRGVKQSGWRPFPGKLWHRNYWEHVVRDESEWNRIREYIRNNPVQWENDRFYEGKGGWHSTSQGVREPAASYVLEDWMV